MNWASISNSFKIFFQFWNIFETVYIQVQQHKG